MHTPSNLIRALAGLGCAAAASAQLPSDAALVLETTPTLVQPYYELVDVLGRGSTRLRDQSVFLATSSVACDPSDAATFYYQSGATSLAGSWQATVGPLASIGQNIWGPWSQLPATRVEVGARDVFTLQAGVVERAPKAGGGATVLFAAPGAVDLAVEGTSVYTVAFDAVSPQALLQWDLLNNSLRTVTQLVGATCIAASPVTAELLVGTASGDVLRVDVQTGAAIHQATGLGALTAIGCTRFGTAVYTDGVALWSELLPSTPIYTSPTSIIDFSVSRALAASVVTFGSGCGSGGALAWTTNGTPRLGNSAWQLGLDGAGGNAAALFAIGRSRTTSAFGGLPLSLQALGFGAGCQLLSSADTLRFLVTSAGGRAVVPIPVPNAPALAGLELAAQWFVSAPVNAAGLAVSEGVALVVR